MSYFTQTEEGGILDVTVKYEALTNEPAKNGKEKDIVLEVDVDGNETPKEEMNVEGTGVLLIALIV